MKASRYVVLLILVTVQINQCLATHKLSDWMAGGGAAIGGALGLQQLGLNHQQGKINEAQIARDKQEAAERAAKDKAAKDKAAKDKAQTSKADYRDRSGCGKSESGSSKGGNAKSGGDRPTRTLGRTGA